MRFIVTEFERRIVMSEKSEARPDDVKIPVQSADTLQVRSKMQTHKGMRGLFCVLVGVIVWFLPIPEGVKPQAWRDCNELCVNRIG